MRDYVKVRQKRVNQYNQEAKRELKNYKEQQDKENAKKKKLEERDSFYNNRPFLLATASNTVVIIAVLFIIINTIGRLLTGTYWYVIPNVLSVVFLLYTTKFVNPLNFASDKEDFYYPKLNFVYRKANELSKTIAKRLGTNLEKNPTSSLTAGMIVVYCSTVNSILFYGSSFAALAIPLLLLFGIRSFLSNTTKKGATAINTHLIVLIMLFIANSIISILWKTPIDYSLLAIITLLNTMRVWMRNTELYSVADVYNQDSYYSNDSDEDDNDDSDEYEEDDEE